MIESEGSFSSGQVAEPLGRKPAKYSWLRVKLPEPTSESSEITFRPLKISFSDEPFQGIATDALLEKKRSQDHVLFAWVIVGPSWFSWFHMYMLESSLAEIMWWPSGVNDAEIWLEELLIPDD